MSTAAQSTSLLGRPMALGRIGILKQSKIAPYLTKTDEKDKVNIKTSLEDMVREVEEKRMRLEHMTQ